MLNKGDINPMHNCYWCVVSGSDIWLLDGRLPKGSSHELDLPLELATEVGVYEGMPVMWLNEADLSCDYVLTSL